MDTALPAATTSTTPLSDNEQPLLMSSRHGSGSIGPFFAVMSVLLVLAVLSCILGRYCGSRAEGPDSWYDCIGWCQRICRGRRHQCVLGCSGGERDVKTAAAVAMDLDAKV